MQHVGIELPNGDIVDIEGIWESSQWLTKWEEELTDVWKIYLAEPDPEDENYDLLYPNEGEAASIEDVVHGKERLTLGVIADRIAVTVNSLND